MKNLNPLNVPKDSPTRKEKINAFKKLHNIETLSSPYLDADKWCALHLPTARKFNYGVTATSDLFDCVSKVGRLLDESGVMGYGNTEREAIKSTCEACGIVCDL